MPEMKINFESVSAVNEINLHIQVIRKQIVTLNVCNLNPGFYPRMRRLRIYYDHIHGTKSFELRIVDRLNQIMYKFSSGMAISTASVTGYKHIYDQLSY